MIKKNLPRPKRPRGGCARVTHVGRRGHLKYYIIWLASLYSALKNAVTNPTFRPRPRGVQNTPRNSGPKTGFSGLLAKNRKFKLFFQIFFNSK